MRYLLRGIINNYLILYNHGHVSWNCSCEKYLHRKSVANFKLCMLKLVPIEKRTIWSFVILFLHLSVIDVGQEKS